MSYAAALIGLAFALSAVLTFVLARQFEGTSLMDQPNERSSHTKPRPRGGGLAFVGASLVCLSLLHGLDLLEFHIWFLFGLLGLAIALAGFLDDQRLVTLEFRLLTQVIVAAIASVVIGGVPTLNLGFATLDLGWASIPIACLFLVWCMNLFNFMDGIDGLSASGAVLALAGAGALALLIGLGLDHAALFFIMASAVGGFLVWNYPPARIFMGSVGSEHLGFVIGLAALHLAWIDDRLFWAMLILAAIFVSDATVTLLMRFAQGENVLLAHRTHAYQYLARRLNGHAPVTLGVIAITAIWLCPLAYVAALGALNPLLATIVAYAPICAFVFFYRTRKRNAALK